MEYPQRATATFVCHPPVTPPPGFKEYPVYEVLTYRRISVLGMDGADLGPDPVWDGRDGLFRLRCKLPFGDCPRFLWRRAPQDRSRLLRPGPVEREPQKAQELSRFRIR
jgi:hypothetical protein